jgi:dihydropteroate synthase
MGCGLGHDLLDVGARAAGVGTRQVSEAEESSLVASTVEALCARFNVPISVDTWRASVACSGSHSMSGVTQRSRHVAAALRGARLLRVHDARGVREGRDLAAALLTVS